MKRIVLFFIILTSIVILGFSQSNNYANGNGTIIGTEIDENIKWTIRKHIQSVKIGDLANDENLNIYNKPVFGNGTIIGKLKLNDTINIIQVAEASAANNYYYCLKINTNNNITGWIFCGKYNYAQAKIYTPYFNNNWEIMQNINIGEKSWTIRKMAYQRVAVFERLNIRDKPGLIDTKVISKIIPTYENSQINLYVSEVTEESETIDGITDRWLKIDYNGINGWVFGGYTSVERGGYKYYTPENIIASKLD